jgi:hypothetical protein
MRHPEPWLKDQFDVRCYLKHCHRTATDPFTTYSERAKGWRDCDGIPDGEPSRRGPTPRRVSPSLTGLLPHLVQGARRPGCRSLYWPRLQRLPARRLPEYLGVEGGGAVVLQDNHLDPAGPFTGFLREFPLELGQELGHVLDVACARPAAAEGGQGLLLVRQEGLAKAPAHERVALRPARQISGGSWLETGLLGRQSSACSTPVTRARGPGRHG